MISRLNQKNLDLLRTETHKAISSRNGRRSEGLYTVLELLDWHERNKDLVGPRRRKILVRQPPGSKVCGQACVAMLLGVTLEEGIARVGKSGPTTPRDLCRALDLKPRYLQNFIDPLALEMNFPIVDHGLSIVRVKEKGNRKGHWVVRIDNMIYDPELDRPWHFYDWVRLLPTGVRPTSSLVIEPPRMKEA